MAPHDSRSGERGGCGCRTFLFLGLAAVGALVVAVLLLSRPVETEVRIDAPPAVVWAGLVDFDGYARWNPYVEEIYGHAREGGEVTARIAVKDFEPFELKARIDVLREREELRWTGHAVLPWVFDDHHYYELTETPSGGTRVIHGSTYRGLVAAFLWWKVEPIVLDVFDSHNRKLKSEAEGR